jgi:superfamily II DNA/RNA helicase
VESAELEDELDFEVEAFSRRVIAPEFNRVICEQLARELDPFGEEKTLIFCATDLHADMVKRLLDEAFQAVYGDDYRQAAVAKITGKADDLIRRYKNDKYPNIAITVDLLTTGIDVPPICHLVFLRRVKSRILYEQMIGRATRRCDAIGKTVFTIYDPVDLYAALAEVNTMQPLVKNPHVTLEQLHEELSDPGQLARALDAPGQGEGESHADDVPRSVQPDADAGDAQGDQARRESRRRQPVAESTGAKLGGGTGQAPPAPARLDPRPAKWLDRLAKQLEADGLKSTAIHGNKTQHQRTRALETFKRGGVRVLVATDVAARGLDIDHLPHVVNYDLPNVPEDYIHRIGRTGRAGRDGAAISLVSADERADLHAIERLLGFRIERRPVEGFPDFSLDKPKGGPRKGNGKPSANDKARQGKPKARRWQGKGNQPQGRRQGGHGSPRRQGRSRHTSA